MEASALGAGMIAGYSAGWFASFDEAAAAMSRITKTVEPDPKLRRTWDELLAIYNRLYPANEKTFNDLVDFAVRAAKAG